MMNSLADILKEYGLELNAKKTKIFCTASPPSSFTVPTRLGRIKVMGSDDKHKYLGREFPGDPHRRGLVALEYRIQCAWSKFRTFEYILTDKHVPMSLRLKLFDTMVTPTILYSLDTCPFTATLENRLDVIQRKMLRKMMGWIQCSEMTWQEIGHQRKIRLEQHLRDYPIGDWSQTLKERKKRLISQSNGFPSWTKNAIEWDPRTT